MIAKATERVVDCRQPLAQRPRTQEYARRRTAEGKSSREILRCLKRYVTDTDHWLGSPKRQEFFGPLGVTGIRTFVDPQHPNRVAVLLAVPDMDTLMDAMNSQAAADAMEYDGVLPKTLTVHIER